MPVPAPISCRPVRSATRRATGHCSFGPGRFRFQSSRWRLRYRSAGPELARRLPHFLASTVTTRCHGLTSALVDWRYCRGCLSPAGTEYFVGRLLLLRTRGSEHARRRLEGSRSGDLPPSSQRTEYGWRDGRHRATIANTASAGIGPWRGEFPFRIKLVSPTPDCNLAWWTTPRRTTTSSRDRLRRVQIPWE